MEKKTFNIGNKKVITYLNESPEMLIIQPVSGDEENFLDEEVEKIASGSGRSFVMVSFHIDDWNDELSPWCAPPVFGNEAFGDGADKTLEYVLNELIPEVRNCFKLQEDIPVCLGGYSLAGLFALWSMYNTDALYAICGVSPSVWFEGWLEYASSHKANSSKIYLSLGLKEEKTKNKMMQRVGDCIRKQYDLLKSEGIECELEWNEGGHFNNPAGRCARGFIRCLNNED